MHPGYEVFVADFMTLDSVSPLLNVISMTDVLEHIPFPRYELLLMIIFNRVEVKYMDSSILFPISHFNFKILSLFRLILIILL